MIVENLTRRVVPVTTSAKANQERARRSSIDAVFDRVIDAGVEGRKFCVPRIKSVADRFRYPANLVLWRR